METSYYGFDTGFNLLDNVLEAGTNLYTKTLDYGVKKREADAQAALRDQEALRLQQIQAAGQTSSFGDFTFPSYTIPLALAGLALIWFLKRK